MKLQNKPHTVRDIIVVGFALFAMFFGAGNVIFPPYLGVEAGPEWLGGFSAYFIADIGLAMCAVFALLRVGSSEAVTARLGKVPAAILMSALILCIGPMVAIPRTAATTFEMAIVPNISGVSSVVFSIIFFAIILFLCIRQSAVVDIVGAILTPLLLIGLAVIIIKGVATPLGEIALTPNADNVILGGIKARLPDHGRARSAAVWHHNPPERSLQGLHHQRPEVQDRLRARYPRRCAAARRLHGLCYLGATVSTQYGLEIGRAELVMAIVEALLGKAGMIIFGVVVGLACVTTAIGLTSSAAAYFTELCSEKVPYKAFVIVICVFSAVASNLGLDRIVSIAAPVLDIVYPPALVVIFISLIIPNANDYVSRGAALGAVGASILCAFKVPAMENLPLYDMGLYWILPAVIFGLLALGLAAIVKPRKSEAEAKI